MTGRPHAPVYYPLKDGNIRGEGTRHALKKPSLRIIALILSDVNRCILGSRGVFKGTGTGQRAFYKLTLISYKAIILY